MIQDQIKAIDAALQWIKINKPEHYDRRFAQLVKQRLELRKLERAERENPAIAAYGESQKGKSHVMNSLLLKDGQPFYVTAPDLTGEMRNFDFLGEINPPTLGNEATGVVTRFTAFEQTDHSISSRYHANHPVLLKLLRPSEVATIIFDSYFNDTDNQRKLDDKEAVNDFAAGLKQRYESAPLQDENPIIEDDIYEMAEYAEHHIGTNADRFYGSNYFHVLARVIRQIPIEEMADAFSILWHQTPELTRLFARLIRAHRQLGFAGEVYTDISTVLNSQNTIMAVVCLKGLNESDWKDLKNDAERYATLYYQDANDVEKRVSNFPKCELAALVAEAVFKIDAEALATDIKFDWSSLPSDSKDKIGDCTFPKDILHSNDLLDFPGARPREDYPVNSLKVDIMIKRGKVAYLFHKYCDDHLINALLYCHDQANVQCTDMYKLISGWVHQFVGKNSDERSKNVVRFGNVPPIFVICTKFNMDLKKMVEDNLNTDTMLNQRWDDRFQKILYKEAIKPDVPSTGDDYWFKDFCGKGIAFDNCYLLRDFKYSSDLAGGNLYRGYDPQKAGSRESVRMDSDDYWRRLKDSFISNSHVQFFFKDPSLAWDVATTMNNDGAQYLIKRLTVVAHKLYIARLAQLKDKEVQSAYQLKNLLADYYINEDGDALLDANIMKAKAVRREMDVTISKDNYFFGHMIERLQVSERDTYSVLHDLIMGTELNRKTANFSEVQLLLDHYQSELCKCQSEDEKWKVLSIGMGLKNRQEAEEFFVKKGIDPTRIFVHQRNNNKNSVVISDSVFDAWINRLRSPSLLEDLVGCSDFDAVIMGQLVDNIIDTANRLHLNDRIEDFIKDEVNVLVSSTIKESLVADMMATIINEFVNNLGFNYLPESEIKEKTQLAQERKLHCTDSITLDRRETYTPEELKLFFDGFCDEENSVTPSFKLNYKTWLDYMFFSFMGKVNSLEYDRKANHAMGEIIKSIN